MINEPTDLFTRKLMKVRHVLVTGEGFADAEVAYERTTAVVRFSAPGAISVTMRRDQFDSRSDCEVAFFVAPRMRKPVAAPVKARRT